MQQYRGDAMRGWVIGAVLGILSVVLLALPSAAQSFSSGSTGTDGAFTPSCTPTPCTVVVPVPDTGVFNFTTVTIPVGVTVTFTPNAENTPVVMLATGDVTIAGTLDVSGQNAGVADLSGRGGPGGFAGGTGGNIVTGTTGSTGLGTGGGTGGVTTSGGSSPYHFCGSL